VPKPAAVAVERKGGSDDYRLARVFFRIHNSLNPRGSGPVNWEREEASSAFENQVTELVFIGRLLTSWVIEAPVEECAQNIASHSKESASEVVIKSFSGVTSDCLS
jgi:hypothetical protein